MIGLHKRRVMQFNVARLLKGPVGTSKRYTLDVEFAPLEDTRIDHLWGRVQFVRVHEGVWVSGSLEATVVCACSRCLQDCPLSVRFDLDDVHVPTVDPSGGAFLPLPEDADSNFTIDDHHVLDITEAVRQASILALPMKPLCRADCVGICSECGINRNEAGCICQDQEIDVRWMPLLKLSPLEG